MLKRDVLSRIEALEDRTKEPEMHTIQVRFIAQAPGLEPGDWSRTVETGGFDITVPMPPRKWKGMRRRRD